MNGLGRSFIVFFFVIIGTLPGLVVAEGDGGDGVADKAELSFWPEADLDLAEFDGFVYETVVKARHVALSAGTKVFSSEDLEKTHAFSADDVVGLVGGVNIVQHGAEGKGGQIYLRGFDAAHGSDVEVLLHGIPVNEPSHVHGQGYLDLYGVIPEVICEMAVYKGPHLPWQGNFSTAGSLRFSLCLPRELRPGIVRGEVSHRGRLRGVVLAAPPNSSKGNFLAVETMYDHGFSAGRQGRRAVLLGGYQRKLGSPGTLTALLLGQTSRFMAPGAMRLEHVEQDLFGFYDNYGEVGEGKSDRLLGRVGFERESAETDFEVFVYGMLRYFYLAENFTGWLMSEESGDRRAQEQIGPSFGAQIALEQKMPFSFKTDLVAGAGWRMDDFEQNEKQLNTRGRPWQTGRKLEASIHQVHLYGGFRMLPFSWLNLFPSLRFDLAHFDVRDRIDGREASKVYWAVSPRVAIGFPVHHTLTLFADYGRGFRMPEARAVVSRTQSEPDEDQGQYRGGRPQVSVCDAVEIGVEFRPLSVIEIRALGFGAFLAREMVFDHVSNTTLEMDGTRRLGFEMEVAFQPLPWFTSSMDFSYTDARFRRSEHPVPGVPSWIAKARVALGNRRGPHGSISLFTLGKRQLAHGASMNGYFKLNLDVGWRFEHFEINAILENVLDQNIPEGAYHYASWFHTGAQRSAIPAIHYTPGEPLTFRAVFTAHL